MMDNVTEALNAVDRAVERAGDTAGSQQERVVIVLVMVHAAITRFSDGRMAWDDLGRVLITGYTWLEDLCQTQVSYSELSSATLLRVNAAVSRWVEAVRTEIPALTNGQDLVLDHVAWMTRALMNITDTEEFRDLISLEDVVQRRLSLPRVRIALEEDEVSGQ
jgi:hypothetical protein